jgi:hypothetical protein
MPKCGVCSRRRGWGTSAEHEVAKELLELAKVLRVLLRWNAEIPRSGLHGAWPEDLANACEEVGGAAHGAVHGPTSERQVFADQHLSGAAPTAVDLIARASAVQTELFARASRLSRPDVWDAWWPRLAAVWPDLARRAARAGLG